MNQYYDKEMTERLPYTSRCWKWCPLASKSILRDRVAAMKCSRETVMLAFSVCYLISWGAVPFIIQDFTNIPKSNILLFPVSICNSFIIIARYIIIIAYYYDSFILIIVLSLVIRNKKMKMKHMQAVNNNTWNDITVQLFLVTRMLRCKGKQPVSLPT